MEPSGQHPSITTKLLIHYLLGSTAKQPQWDSTQPPVYVINGRQHLDPGDDNPTGRPGHTEDQCWLPGHKHHAPGFPH